MPRIFPNVTGRFYISFSDPRAHFIVWPDAQGAWSFKQVASWKSDDPREQGYTNIDTVLTVLADGVKHGQWDQTRADNANIAWVMDGEHWCLDLDGKNIEEAARAMGEEGDDLQAIMQEIRDDHANLLEVVETETYVETSRSGNGQHIIFKKPADVEPNTLKSKNLHFAAELYTGKSLADGSENRFIILTGRRFETSPAEPQELAPSRVNSICRRFEREAPETHVDLTPIKTQDDKPIDEVTHDLMHMSPRMGWYVYGPDHHIAGEQVPAPKVTGTSEMRLDFLQAIATVCYGMPRAETIMWEILKDSWFAREGTAIYSQSNKRRFETYAGRANVRRHCIPAAMRKVQRNKLEAAGNAQDIVQDLAKGRLPTDDAEKWALTVKGLELAKNSVRVQTVVETAPLEIKDCPVDLYKQMAAHLRNSQEIKNDPLCATATILAMAVLAGNKVVGPTGLFPSLYIVATAGSGGGKAVMELETLPVSLPQHVHKMGPPASDVALHVALMRNNVTGFGLIDELGEWMGGVAKSTNKSVRGILRLLKILYSQSRLTGLVPDQSSSTVEREELVAPCYSFGAMGTPDAVFSVFNEYGTRDGLLGRNLYFSGTAGTQRNARPVDVWDESEVVAVPKAVALETRIPKSLERDLREILDKQRPMMPAARGRMIATKTVQWGTGVQDRYEQFKAKVLSHRASLEDEGRFIEADLHRSLFENLVRIATGLAYWNGSDITHELFDWAKYVVMTSHRFAEANITFAKSEAQLLADKIEAGMIKLFTQNKGGRGKKEDREANRERGEFLISHLPGYDTMKSDEAKSNNRNLFRDAIELLAREGKIVPSQGRRYTMGSHYKSLALQK